FMGTPGYAPPEAISQGRYTAQADVFAWGAVLYELLSGRIPYEGPDTRTTNGYVLKSMARSPREHDPSIPEPLADVVMQALHPSIDARPRDGAAAEALLRKAWEFCTSNDLIKVQSLTGPELPHSEVGATMHHTTSRGALEDGGRARGKRPEAKPGRHGPGDDDPTTVLARPAPETAAAADAEVIEL